MLSTILLAALAQAGGPTPLPAALQQQPVPVSRPADADLASARKAFVDADFDHSGKLDAAERAASALTAGDCLLADLDRDGQLSADEFTVAFRERAARKGTAAAPDLEAEVARVRGRTAPGGGGVVAPRVSVRSDVPGNPVGPAALRRKAEAAQRESPAATEERVRAARAALTERLGQLHDDPKADPAARSAPVDVSVLRRSAIDRARNASSSDAELEVKARQAREALNRRLNDPRFTPPESPNTPAVSRLRAIPAPTPEKPIGPGSDPRRPDVGAPSPKPSPPPAEAPQPKPSRPPPGSPSRG